VSGRSKDQDLIDKLAAWIQAPDVEAAQSNGHTTPLSRGESSSMGPSDEQVISACRSAGNALKFEDLYDRGDVRAYHGGDDSAADLALLGILKFYTQDEAQLERLFSSSALGQRAKWRQRGDYRKRTIARALAKAGETYDWNRNRGAVALPIKGSSASGAEAAGRGGDSLTSPYIGKSPKSPSDETPALSLVRFAGRPAPSVREFIIPDLMPRHHPTTLYGWGGTAKSLIAALLAMSVAGGREKFFGRDVAVHGPALFLDFELDADEQHRRVMQLAAGMEMEVPDDLLYVSTLGARTHEAISFGLSVCEEHKAVLVVLDSLGPAMVGDMAAARDVIEFHNCYIAPFKAARITPVLVDHQARQQAGEGYQSKGAFGSAYKEHLSRSLIQVEAGDRSAEQGTLNVRLRHKKTNFGALCDPFDVALSFSEEKITASVRELTSADRAQEATLNARDRVLAALEDGPAYPDDLVESTGLARSTIRNELNKLKKAGRVEKTGEARGQLEEIRLTELADSLTHPIRGKSAKSPAGGDGLFADEGKPPSVAGLFADPPNWLCKQIKMYRKDPERQLWPLCAAVAAAVLDDPTRGPEVHEEVERELGRLAEV
jgi:DNA-binding transcriptional ArsR family regulator